MTGLFSIFLVFNFSYFFIFLKDISSGKSILFAPRLPEDYAVWLGKIKPLSYYKVILYLISCNRFRIFFNMLLSHFINDLQEYYMVDMVFYADEIVEVLHNHWENPGKPLLFLLYGLNTDSGNYSKPAMIKVIFQ